MRAMLRQEPAVTDSSMQIMQPQPQSLVGWHAISFCSTLAKSIGSASQGRCQAASLTERGSRVGSSGGCNHLVLIRIERPPDI